jgi:hypothetical protein
MLAAYTNACGDLRHAVTTWRAIRGAGLDSLNALLTKHGQATIAPTGETLAIPVCGAPAAPRHR